ncbi:hypothetical protein OAB88_06345 [Winogradskyella sp.]|nr:hypothetical protein [Winogradskyella sp.]
MIKVRTVKHFLKQKLKPFYFSRSQKVFCIGRNKTGTTSMSRIFVRLGLSLGSQSEAELLADDWMNNNFDSLIAYVKYKGISFQDVPFSFPNTFKVLDEAFPNSKFILTVRDSSEVWYNSVISYMPKINSSGNRLPDKIDLQNDYYVYKGWKFKTHQFNYNTPEDDLFNKAILIKHYNDYNASVIDYFKDKPGQLLVINLKAPDAINKICVFLNKKNTLGEMPWVNKTKDFIIN